MSLVVLLKGHYANPDLSRETRNLHELMQSPDRILNHRPVAKPRPTRTARHLPAKDSAEICKKYKNGSTTNQLATEFNVHRTTIMNHLERNGIKRRVSKPKMNKKMIAEAAQLRKNGKSYTELGRHFGVHRETVRRALSAEAEK